MIPSTVTPSPSQTVTGAATRAGIRRPGDAYKSEPEPRAAAARPRNLKRDAHRPVPTAAAGAADFERSNLGGSLALPVSGSTP